MSTKPTVLFVDDEPHIVNLLKVMFRGDYEVLSATSGEGALDIVQTHKVHVIVSDQRMPGMLGTELLSKVRKLSPATMRILLTGYSDLAAMVGSINEGEIYRFISKPWNNDEIRGIVREAAEAAISSQSSAVLGAEEVAPETVGGDPGLLVLDENLSQDTWFASHFGTDFPVYAAKSIDAALDVLEKRDVGVVIADSRVGGEETLGLLRVLKQQYPVVMTVMLTTQADSDAVLKMINQAQVCRLSFKPIRRGALDIAIKAAMMHHRRYRADPALACRQRVSRASDGDSPVAQSLLGRLRNIGRRFSLRAVA